MVCINAVSSVVASHEVGIDEMARFFAAHAPSGWCGRLIRSLVSSGNQTRYTVLPIDQLVQLSHAGQRSSLYREHAVEIAEQAISALADTGALRPREVSTVIFVSSTGWAAPSVETQLVRRFGLDARCRRIPLAQL